MSSTKKITQLTPGQETRMAEVYQEWLEVGRGCAPLDRADVSKVCTEFYAAIGKPAPSVLFFSSPMMCVLAYNVLRNVPKSQLGSQLRSQLGSQLGSQIWSQLGSQLRSQLGSQLWSQLRSQLGSQLESQLRSQLWSQLGSQLGSQLESQLRSQLRSQLGSQLESQLRSGQLCWPDYFAGQHWCAWEVFYAFCGEIGVTYPAPATAILQLWLRQSRSMHWWFPFDGVVIASERHTDLHLDDAGRLHSPDRMACSYSDGWGIHSWHGVTIPERYYASDVPAREILAEPNAEVRRAMMERYDEQRENGRFLLDCGARVVDSAVQPMRPGQADSVNELLALDLPADDPEGRMVYMRLIDPSTDRQYMIRVPPAMASVQEALAWSFGVPKHEYVLEQES